MDDFIATKMHISCTNNKSSRIQNQLKSRRKKTTCSLICLKGKCLNSLDSVIGSFQQETPDKEDDENEVGKSGGEVDNFAT